MRLAKLPLVTTTLCLTAAVAACSSNAAARGSAPAPASTTPASTAPVPAAPVPAATVSPASAPATSAAAERVKTAPVQKAPVKKAATGARPLDPGPPPTDPACAPAAILPTAERLVDDPAAGLKVQAVQVAVCRNGYARVFTVPARTPQRFEGDQLFLRLVDGAWTLVGRGASIDCGDAGLQAAIARACAALG
ncbi:hypothetical protein [Actinoplanes auranticolor]|uniref:Uncharacterized protein n=1 Tax=Actinoplanes auranticolor TaxID=47988 RepID=A0A919SH23_9ACTN|nr:hypothetical protein [Actinoplanes auranticolor]GIM72292.1 hypothetical protein Aau02nite_50250 [Actinoplanes auranticolor]